MSWKNEFAKKQKKFKRKGGKSMLIDFSDSPELKRWVEDNAFALEVQQPKIVKAILRQAMKDDK